MKTKHKLEILVSYCQLALFDCALSEPFNDWTEQHTAQGFTWRPECVAFGTLEEFGEHQILVGVVDCFEPLLPSAVRVIDVPFEVPAPGRIEIASISDSAFFDVAAGLYQLRFQAFKKNGGEKALIVLCFCRSAAPVFSIVRADKGLNPGDHLLLTASPA